MSFLDAIKAPFVSKPEPLTPSELSRLNQLRQTIRDGIRGWIAAGEASATANCTAPPIRRLNCLPSSSSN